MKPEPDDALPREQLPVDAVFTAGGRDRDAWAQLLVDAARYLRRHNPQALAVIDQIAAETREAAGGHDPISWAHGFVTAMRSAVHVFRIKPETRLDLNAVAAVGTWLESVLDGDA